MSGRYRTALWTVAFVALLVASVVTGVGVAYQSHLSRTLHAELKNAQVRHDELRADYSRLLLERSVLSSYRNVDRLAVDSLAMQFPDQTNRVTVGDR